PLSNLLIDLHGYRPYITDLAVAAIDGMLHDVMRRVDTKNGKRWVFDTSLDTFHLRPITSKVTTDKEESEFVEKVRKAFVIASDYMGYPDQETRDMGEHPASPQFREIDGVPHIAYNAVRLEIYMRRYGVRYPIDILAEALGHILDRGPLNAWELRKPRLKRERTLELKLKILR